MASKLDLPLDDMIKSRRQSARRRGGTRVTVGARAKSAIAPTGGISKVSKSAKPTKGDSARHVAAISGSGESKIIVTGLPSDVSEQQIKDYFAKTIGPVKKVFLTYGPNGQSRGISTIVFTRPGSAAEAAAQLNGVKVDNRAMKIEVVVGADQAPVPVPAKALGERIIKQKTTKTQPKPATATANTASSRGRGRARKGRNVGRGKPKTAEELDAEMTDYFDAGVTGNAAAAPNGVNGTVSQPVGNVPTADTGMEDEIM